MRKKCTAIWIIIAIVVLWGMATYAFKTFGSRGKPEAILLIDVADYNIGGRERILEWLTNNDEVKNKFDFRVIIAANADLLLFNPFEFYDEIEAKLGAKNLIHATMPDMTLSLYFSSVFFVNKDIFSDKTEKNLIILSSSAGQSRELKDFQLDNPEIKITIATLKETIPKKRKMFPFKRKSENLATIAIDSPFEKLLVADFFI